MKDYRMWDFIYMKFQERTIVTESRYVVARCGDGERGLTAEGKKEPFCSLIVVVVTQLHTFYNTH